MPSARVACDGFDDLRPHGNGQRVAHALDYEELGAGYGLGRGVTALDTNQRVGVAVDDSAGMRTSFSFAVRSPEATMAAS